MSKHLHMCIREASNKSFLDSKIRIFKKERFVALCAVHESGGRGKFSAPVRESYGNEKADGRSSRLGDMGHMLVKRPLVMAHVSKSLLVVLALIYD
ncbi:hypothetical protein CEXT_656981 [Caerostris extrusa]|uniref:Uncharacterized protein n=1 Tax=Caerostris extrusa TaxID=172846 RepID=A0AAV4M856_CAEEX|nr:hypothetical protein CEXT_656981 [Caerostris extrusa]